MPHPSTVVARTSTTTVTSSPSDESATPAASSTATVSPAAATTDGATGSVDDGHVDSPRALIFAILDGEGHLLSLVEGAESFGSDRGLMDEEVLPAIFRPDEPEAFLGAEPPHHPAGSLSFCHLHKFLEIQD